MWGIRPKGPLGAGRIVACAILLLALAALFAAILAGGGARGLSVGAYHVDYTVVAGAALLSLGALVLVLRRPRL